jgi:hypothetical protein
MLQIYMKDGHDQLFDMEIDLWATESCTFKSISLSRAPLIFFVLLLAVTAIQGIGEL